MQISLHSIRTDEFPALMYRPRGSVTLTITTVKFWTRISRRDHRIRSWRVNKKVMWRFHPQFELAQLWNDLDQTMEGNHKVSKKEKKKGGHISCDNFHDESQLVFTLEHSF